MKRAFLVCVFAATAVGCGNYGGESDSGSAGLSSSGGGDGFSNQQSIQAFAQTAYPMLRDYCAECHAGAGPGSPHIAHSDVTTAHGAVMNNQKANMSDPSRSRLVQRLVTDFHHCWSSCMDDGDDMLQAIANWAAQVDFDGGDNVSVDGIATNPVRFADGVEDDGSERYSDNLIALWEFKEGSGGMAPDTSGVNPEMDLELTGEVEWLSAYGLAFDGGRAIATMQDSRKLYERIADPASGSGQYSIEAWVVPDNTDQEGPARIISYSNGPFERNFTLGQVLYTYDFRNRSMNPDIDENGTPALTTYDADEDLQATQQHVVITYDQFNGRRIYVNGEFTDDEDEFNPNRLWNWDRDYRFLLGNETTNNRDWIGQVRLAAVYNQALTNGQIRKNFQAGVGKRVIMNFDVSQWAGVGVNLEFVVSEFDDYSYLFCQPTLVGSGLDGIRVQNIRIAVNGLVPVSGQAFRTMDVAASGSQFELSRQCSIIAKDDGPDLDLFSIVFETLANFSDPEEDDFPDISVEEEFGDALPFEGVRDFARINETMARVTGIDPSDNDDVRDTYSDLTQQLPPGFDIRSFVSSNQVAVAKLALEYCNALVEDSGARDDFFGTSFDFGSDPTPTDAGDWTPVVDALMTKMIGDNVANQPTRNELDDVLVDGNIIIPPPPDPNEPSLLESLTSGCPTGCDAERTRTISKGMCAAVLSSAAVHIH